MTAPLTEPTSDTIAPGRSAGAMARPIASLAPSGRAEDDAIGVAHRASQIVGDEVAKPQGFRALQSRDRFVGKDNAPCGMAVARGASDRRADQPDADNRQLFEDRLGQRRAKPFNHLCPA